MSKILSLNWRKVRVDIDMFEALWDEVTGSCDPVKLQKVLEGKADPSAVLDGWTPLHFLCENRSVDPAARVQGLRLLLQAGFDSNAVDENGLSPLHLLCKNKSGRESNLVPSVKQLVMANADVNLQTTNGKKSALHFLCENEAVTEEALEVLLKADSNVNAVDEDGNTPLHYLGENGFVTESMFSLMLAAKANLNIQNSFQATPAHYICQNNRLTQRMIGEMLKHKANFNIKNNIANTPVHYLCGNDVVMVDMLKELMTDKHVNVTVPNSVSKRKTLQLKKGDSHSILNIAAIQLGKLASDYIPSGKEDCLEFLKKFAPPNLVTTGGCSKLCTEIGGEDPSELPEPLQTALATWNASLPPFDAAFYNAISCEPAFESVYNEVQEVSGRACENPGDIISFAAWEKSLSNWRACILLAYAALVPPNIWHQYAEHFQRPLPSDLMKVVGKVQTAWKQFPEQTQRRDRFQALAVMFTP